MLETIIIKNFVLAKKITIELGNGLNVFTGETGAGKTLIINAIRFCLGEELNKELIIRNNENKPIVQLIFSNDEKEIIFERTISEAGKSRTLIDGLFVPLKNYRDICSKLISIHGQRSSEELFSPKMQLFFFDYYFKDKLSEIIERVKMLRLKYINLRKEIQNIETQTKERAREIDFLKFQINEIEQAQLRDGEEESLKAEREILSNAQKIIESMNAITTILDGKSFEDRGLIKEIEQALNIIKEIKTHSPNLENIEKALFESYSILKDVSKDASDEAQKLIKDYDEKRLDEIVERINTINNLKRKYGETIKDVIGSKMEAEERLNNLLGIENNCEELRKELDRITSELQENLIMLSSKRESLKNIFESKVEEELCDLSMNKAKFVVNFKREESEEDFINTIKIENKNFKLFETGLEKIEFLLSTNPGQPLLPLASIASGGELSRIILAIKTILREVDDTPTLIFDEIDSGIGGEVGDKVGDKLHQISERKQVICITHLSQIASKGDHHFIICKETEMDDTSINIRKAQEKDRIIEISRMIGGDYLSEASLAHAEEILRNQT